MGGYTGDLPMSPENQGRQFRFSVFEANEATGELRKQGIRIKLHSQPFQVLVMLIEKPSELVTRDEMRQRLWGEDTFVDFDHGLNTAVNKLREALGDLASQPRHVETVPGKGYRFIAPVTLAAPAPKASVEQVAVVHDAAASAAGSAIALPDASSTALGTFLTAPHELDRKSTRLNSSHVSISYAV